MSTTRKNLFLWLRICCLVLAGAAFAGCGGAQMIRGTRIPANDENVAILTVVEKYRNGHAERDVAALVALADEKYFQPSHPEHPRAVGFAELSSYLTELFRKQLTQQQASNVDPAQRRPNQTTAVFHESKPVSCPSGAGDGGEPPVCRRITLRYTMRTLIGDNMKEYTEYAQMDLIRRRGGNWRILNGM